LKKLVEEVICMANQYEKKNPRTLYPKISPKKVMQAEPGLDDALAPAADHGQPSLHEPTYFLPTKNQAM